MAPDDGEDKQGVCMSNKLRRKWRSKKYDAEKRGIGFFLTFEDYSSLLHSAGLSVEDIGATVGKYCLGRIGDEGDYTPTNCRFITVSENQREGVLSKREHGLSLGGGSHDSVKGNQHYSSRGYVVTPWGTFETIRQAAAHAAATCNHQNIHKKIKNNISGFYYSVVDNPP